MKEKSCKINDIRNTVDKTEFVIISFAIFFRLFMSIIHFTHYDDIGLAMSILMNSTNKLIRVFAYRFWTYAPFQVLLQSLIIDKKYTYELNLFLGRLPSLFFGIMSLFLTIKMIRLYIPDSWYRKIIELCGLIFISLSWENIIYSAQMEPYEIGVFFVLLQIIFYKRIINKNLNLTRKDWIVFSSLIILSCYSQYQLFVVSAVTIVALLCVAMTQKHIKFIKQLVFNCVFITLLVIPLMIDVFKRKLLERGTNWNIGKNGEFIFHVKPELSIIAKVKYIIQFLTRNSALCIKYEFTSSFGSTSNILTVVVLCFICLGFIYIFRFQRQVFLLLFLNIVSYFVLCFLGKYTLGPSRHSLVLYPVWLLLFMYGINMLCRLSRPFGCIIVFIICFATIIAFVSTMPNEVRRRNNHFSTDNTVALMRLYKPIYVCAYNTTYDLNLMNIPEYTNRSSGFFEGLLCNSVIQQAEPGTVCIWISRCVPLSDELFKTFYDGVRSTLGENYFSKISNMSLKLKYECPSDTEIEYASGFYENFKNGLYMYVFEYN